METSKSEFVASLLAEFQNRKVKTLYELVNLIGNRFPNEDLYLNVEGELEGRGEATDDKYPNLVIPSPLKEDWKAIDSHITKLVDLFYVSNGVNWWNLGKDNEGNVILLSTGERL